MSGWSTVFDASRAPFQWGTAGEGLAGLAILALAVGGWVALRRRAALRWAAFTAGALLAGAWFASSIAHHRAHRRCVEAAGRGEGEVVEGVVRDLGAPASGWRSGERGALVVGGVAVPFPLVAEVCGYHRAAPEGGTLRVGDRVRLLVWQGEILRVERLGDGPAAPGAGTSPR